MRVKDSIIGVALVVILATSAFLLEGAAHAGCIPPPPPPPSPPVPITLTADDTKIHSLEESEKAKREMFEDLAGIYVGQSESNMLKSQLIYIRQHLNPSDLALLNATVIGVVWADDIAACSFVDRAGVTHINISTGLYRYLDLLIETEVQSRRSKKPSCANAYSAYLTMVAQYNAGQAARQLPSYRVELPTYFAKDHLDICSNVELEDVAFNTPGDIWSLQYQYAIAASLDFVVLHELGHIKHGDIFRRLDQSPEGIKIGRAQETSADQFALDFFTSEKIPPVLALPIFYLVATIQNFPVEPIATDVHPSTLARYRMVAQASAKIRTKHFRAWLKKQPSDTVADSDQFKDYFNRLQQQFPPIR